MEHFEPFAPYYHTTTTEGLHKSVSYTAAYNQNSNFIVVSGTTTHVRKSHTSPDFNKPCKDKEKSDGFKRFCSKLFANWKKSDKPGQGSPKSRSKAVQPAGWSGAKSPQYFSSTNAGKLVCKTNPGAARLRRRNTVHVPQNQSSTLTHMLQQHHQVCVIHSHTANATLSPQTPTTAPSCVPQSPAEPPMLAYNSSGGAATRGSTISKPLAVTDDSSAHQPSTNFDQISNTARRGSMDPGGTGGRVRHKAGRIKHSNDDLEVSKVKRKLDSVDSYDQYCRGGEETEPRLPESTSLWPKLQELDQATTRQQAQKGPLIQPRRYVTTQDQMFQRNLLVRSVSIPSFSFSEPSTHNIFKTESQSRFTSLFTDNDADDEEEDDYYYYYYVKEAETSTYGTSTSQDSLSTRMS